MSFLYNYTLNIVYVNNKNTLYFKRIYLKIFSDFKARLFSEVKSGILIFILLVNCCTRKTLPVIPQTNVNVFI